MEIPRISPREVIERMAARERVVLLDSRSAHAWAASDRQIAGSIRVPPDDVDSHLAQIPKDALVVSYCT